MGGPAAMNGCSSEILYLLDPAQGLCMPEGNTSAPRYWQAVQRRPGVDGPFAQHIDVNQATSEALRFLIGTMTHQS